MLVTSFLSCFMLNIINMESMALMLSLRFGYSVHHFESSIVATFLIYQAQTETDDETDETEIVNNEKYPSKYNYS